MNFFFALLATVSASLCLTSMAKYALKSDEIISASPNQFTVTHGDAKVGLQLSEGTLSAKSETNVLLFIMRLNNTVVYPPMKQPSDSFLAPGDVPLAPVQSNASIKVEAGDLIIIAIPPDSSKNTIEGLPKMTLYGALLKQLPIESADIMEQLLGSLVIHYHPLQKYHLLAINVSASDECIRPSEIKEVILPLSITFNISDITQLPYYPAFIGIFIYTAIMWTISIFTQFTSIFGIDMGPAFIPWSQSVSSYLPLIFLIPFACMLGSDPDDQTDLD